MAPRWGSGIALTSRGDDRPCPAELLALKFNSLLRLAVKRARPGDLLLTRTSAAGPRASPRAPSWCSSTRTSPCLVARRMSPKSVALGGTRPWWEWRRGAPDRPSTLGARLSSPPHRQTPKDRVLADTPTKSYARPSPRTRWSQISRMPSLRRSRIAWILPMSFC